ncbi:MAG: Copper amine oxidase, enzyme domain protein [Acidobacteria bacterium]|nr:Copper amine oxidase, enzyme domain protein [Acidobacteriota bacterium]
MNRQEAQGATVRGATVRGARVRGATVRGAASVAVAVLLNLGAAQLHPGEYAPADIAYGSRLYDAQCTTCHGASGDGVGGVDLRSGKFRNAVTDQDLTRVVTTGIPGTGMQAFKFDASEISGIIAFLRNMNAFDRGSVTVGDAARGRAVFDGKGACARCHRIGTQGSRVAPDLSDIGAIRSAGSLPRSLMDPTSQMMPINRPVRAVTRDGKVVNGRRLNEDTYTVQLIDDQERLVSLAKSDLAEFTIATVSPMPSFSSRLTPDEIADVVAYLLSLKGR